MATPLKLEIVMSMVDKVLAPLRGVDRQSKSTAQGLRDTRASLKQLEKAPVSYTHLTLPTIYSV